MHLGIKLCTLLVLCLVNHVYSMPSHQIRKRADQSFLVGIKVLDERPYKYGRLLNVECVVAESEDIYEMEWIRENAPSRAVYYKSYNKILMEIKGVIPMDFGKYTCIARHRDGVVNTNSITFKRDIDTGSGFDYEIEHQVSEISRPIVQPILEREDEETKEEEQPQFIQDNQSAIGNINNDRTIKILEEFQTYTHEGETVKFTCEVQGESNDEIKWEKNMAKLPDNHEIDDNVLILKDVRMEDNGYYICAHGKKSASVFLGIANKDDPITIVRIQTDKKLVNTIEGNQVKLDCEVVGELPTRVWWSKHQENELPDNHRIIGNQLILDDVQIKKNFGYYECFGENDLGTFSDFIYLDIEEAGQNFVAVENEEDDYNEERGPEEETEPEEDVEPEEEADLEEEVEPEEEIGPEETTETEEGSEPEEETEPEEDVEPEEEADLEEEVEPGEEMGPEETTEPEEGSEPDEEAGLEEEVEPEETTEPEEEVEPEEEIDSEEISDDETDQDLKDLKEYEDYIEEIADNIDYIGDDHEKSKKHYPNPISETVSTEQEDYFEKDHTHIHTTMTEESDNDHFVTEQSEFETHLVTEDNKPENVTMNWEGEFTSGKEILNNDASEDYTGESTDSEMYL